MKNATRTVRPGLIVLTLALLPGCLLAAAGIGAGVVVALSEDTARVDLRAAPDAIYDEAVRIVESRGEVTSTEETKKTLEGDVDSSKVTITVFRVDEFTRVKVKARKLAGMAPDLDLAEEIATDLTRAF